ncbi:MAG: ThiF family adenylyltransferase [Planctomycetaceae bacterium]
MDFSRISNSIDVDALQSKQVTIFGTGGSVGLIGDLTRCGVKRWLLIDPDRIGAENMARQGHNAGDVGQYKVSAVKAMILGINPSAEVHCLTLDLTTMPEEEAALLVGGTDLFIAATDSFRAQALVNRLALIEDVPAVFIGIYAGGLGAEVVWTDPVHQLPCFRCLCSNRYAAQQQAVQRPGVSLDPSSQGADIFSVRIPDAIAGQIVVGLLTRGADNRYGRLMEHLGDRQFLQVGMSPEFELNGRDIIREKLGIAEGQSHYVAWNTIALADPDRGALPCPDCDELRVDKFGLLDELVRINVVPQKKLT